MNKQARLTAEEIGIRMGTNLGFVEKIMLTDGTILENRQVLYRAPIPDKEQFEMIFAAANEVSRNILGIATSDWSAYHGIEQRTQICDR